MRKMIMVLPLLAGAFSSTCYGQTSDCQQYMLRAYRTIDQKYAAAANSGKPLRLAAEVETRLKRSGRTQTGVSVQRLVTVVNGSYSYVSNGTTEMYQGPGQLVLVDQSQRMVYLSNATASDQTTMVPDVAKFRDGLVAESTVIACKPVTRQGRAYRWMRLQPKPALRDRLACDYLELLVDEQKQDVQEYTLFYNASSPLASVQYRLVDISSKDRGITAGKPFAMVLDSNNRLLSRYTGYQLVDKRKH